MKKERVKTVAIVLLGVAVLALVCLNVGLRKENKAQARTVDSIFQRQFSALCGSFQISDPDPAVQAADSRACWNILPYTSYTANRELTDVMTTLFQWGELGRLNEKVDGELGIKLAELSYRLGSYGLGWGTRDSDKETDKLIHEIHTLIDRQTDAPSPTPTE